MPSQPPVLGNELRAKEEADLAVCVVWPTDESEAELSITRQGRHHPGVPGYQAEDVEAVASLETRRRNATQVAWNGSTGPPQPLTVVPRHQCR